MSARQFPVTPAALRPEEWKLFRNGDIPPQPHGNSLLPCHHNRPHLNSAFFANFFFLPVDWVKFGRILTLVCSKFLISCYWAECKISFAVTLRFCSRLSMPHCLFFWCLGQYFGQKIFCETQFCVFFLLGGFFSRLKVYRRICFFLPVLHELLEF